jgi:hypothetical protein
VLTSAACTLNTYILLRCLCSYLKGKENSGKDGLDIIKEDLADAWSIVRNGAIQCVFKSVNDIPRYGLTYFAVQVGTSAPDLEMTSFDVL